MKKNYKILLLLFTLLLTFAITGCVAINKDISRPIVSVSQSQPSMSSESISSISSSVQSQQSSETPSSQISSSSSSSIVSSSSIIVNYDITITQVTGGTISVSKTSATIGEEITLSNTLSAGYSFGSYIVKQGSTTITVTNGKFTMPAGNVSVTATFNKVSYSVSITQVTGGTISVSKTSATVGEEITLSNTLSAGYSFGSYIVKQGSTTITVTNGKFTMPAGNVSVTATFNKQTFTVTILISPESEDAYGTVSQSSVTAEYGATISVSGNILKIGNTSITPTPRTSPKYNYSFDGWSVTSGTVTSNMEITATFSRLIKRFIVTLVQPEGGVIKIGSSTSETREVKYGQKITLSNTPSQGYTFSSYKVNGETYTSTELTVYKATTITGVFIKGIVGLTDFVYTSKNNLTTNQTGTITINGSAVSSTQSLYPSVSSKVRGNFYFETEIALDSSRIYNGDKYCKLGIVVISGGNAIYGYIDAMVEPANGYGSNTWLGYASGRGALNSGIDWAFIGSTDHCGNFRQNYASNTTYIKLGISRVDGLYKFFANEQFMYSVWQPEMSGDAELGLLAFNIGFEAKNSKIGYGESVINNVNSYYNLTSSLHPTTRTIDGKIDGRAVNDSNQAIDYSWEENLINSYGTSDGTRYMYSTAFKGTDGIYVVSRARTKNYITNSSKFWTNTNLEIRAIGANNGSVRIFFAANGQMGVANSSGEITDSNGFKQRWGYYNEINGYKIVTVEALIPYSALGGDVTISSKVGLRFAFRSEETGYNMQEGADGVWWCGVSSEYVDISTTGSTLVKETAPTETNIKPGVIGGDPFIMPYNNRYYLYLTHGVSTGFKVYVSEDLKSWRQPTDADFAYVGITPNVEQKLGWAFHANTANAIYNYIDADGIKRSKFLWAPEVAYNSSTGKFVMTYSGYAAGDLATVSVATSDSPLGPFIDVYGGEAGFLAPTGDANKASIDASIFVDTDGTPYLYYCNDCTRNGIDNFKGDGVYWGISETWVVKLDSTWTKTTGTHTKCITPYQGWETQQDSDAPNTAWNEGPFVYKHNGTYYMTYSANPYWNALYGVGLAFAKSPTGPWTKYHANPIVVKEQGKTSGTGHNMLFKDFNGNLWCAYHTYSDPNAVPVNGSVQREILLSRAWFENGILKVEYKNW